MNSLSEGNLIQGIVFTGDKKAIKPNKKQWGNLGIIKGEKWQKKEGQHREEAMSLEPSEQGHKAGRRVGGVVTLSDFCGKRYQRCHLDQEGGGKKSSGCLLL